jgi:hypothetical protein
MVQGRRSRVQDPFDRHSGPLHWCVRRPARLSSRAVFFLSFSDLGLFATTQTRSAPSRLTSQSEAVSSPARSSPPRCSAPLSSVASTSTLSRVRKKSIPFLSSAIFTKVHIYYLEYARYEKRHKNLAAHCSPAFRVEVGDTVTVGQCRPLSKVRSHRPIGSLSLLQFAEFSDNDFLLDRPFQRTPRR